MSGDHKHCKHCGDDLCERVGGPHTCEPYDDDYYDYSIEDEMQWECDLCHGEGFVEYLDCPAVWGEDCPSLQNHLVACPECGGTGTAT